MRDFKYGIILLAVILGGYILVETYRHILPFVAEDEYYIYETVSKDDKNIRWRTVHSKNCPYEKSAWFKRKHGKYNFVLEKDTYICDECFDEDEAKKMLMLHSMNLQSLYERYRRYYSDEKTDSLLRAEYNTNANMREVYYGE